MRINNNIMAMNAHRQLGVTNAAAGKTLEKLSSGMRINRAGDDAAGLAISEKMRAQIRGLNMASKNAQDGISLIQTAEGALNETHAILQRMRELAVQSANDTNVGVDRGELQKEIDQLAQEITRISETTQFNTQDLLTGEFSGKFHIGANEGQDITLSIGNMGSNNLGVQGIVTNAMDATIDSVDLKVRGLLGEDITIKYDTEDDANASAVENTTAKYDADSKTITVKLQQAAGDGDETVGVIEAKISDVVKALNATGVVEVSFDESNDKTISTAPTETIDISIETLKIDEEASKTKGINISTQETASTAITTINTAVETVSAERAKLGAYQNRLEHTIKNLDTSAENLQASESRIRDIDMAKEMMEFTKNNILQQAATAMLAQANQAPQSVLQLLR